MQRGLVSRYLLEENVCATQDKYGKDLPIVSIKSVAVEKWYIGPEL